VLAIEGTSTRARYSVDIQISKPPLIPQSVIDKLTDEMTRVQLPRTLDAFKARAERAVHPVRGTS
jgi:coenzyme Q-binding protein COQ10